MTATHARPRTAVLVLLTAALAAALGLGLTALYNPPALAAPAPATPVTLHRVDAIPATPAPAADLALLAVAFGPGADVTDAQVAEVALTRDRVCEAVTARVPAAVQIATLVRGTGMLPAQARLFAATAAAGCTR